MDKRAERKPIVSIIVVTYNSSLYVIETLESAKSQTFSGIELIVTDDGSTDNTLELCQNWIAKNKDSFVSTQLITTPKNTGIVPNINRGYKAANGEWLKFIAGDDVLVDTCIADFMSYCNQNKDCEIVFGRTYFMGKKGLTEKPLEKIAIADPKEQKKIIYKGSGLSAPALFIKKSLLELVGGYSSQYTFVEDLPLWIKIVNHKKQIHFINNFVVKYRIHEDNICLNNNKNYFFNRRFYNDNEKIILRELLPYYLKKLYIGNFLHNLNYIIVSRMILLFGNKNNFISRMLNLLIVKTTFKRTRIFLSEKLAIF